MSGTDEGYAPTRRLCAPSATDFEHKMNVNSTSEGAGSVPVSRTLRVYSGSRLYFLYNTLSIMNLKVLVVYVCFGVITGTPGSSTASMRTGHVLAKDCGSGISGRRRRGPNMLNTSAMLAKRRSNKSSGTRQRR
eukprot:141220-Rhodomonas_salina.1